MRQFIVDPVGVIQQQTGVQLPSGFHCHYVDASNNYSPTEGSATNQLSGQDSSGAAWTRVEVRTSSGAGPVASLGASSASPSDRRRRSCGWSLKSAARSLRTPRIAWVVTLVMGWSPLNVVGGAGQRRA